MGVSLPDGSVLLVAVEAAIKPIAEAQKDVNFKLNMAKSELSLPYKPALSSVLTYADHVIAELQQVIPYGKDQGAKLKGVTTDSQAPSSTSTSPTGKGQKQQSPCKFWSTDEGCRRGSTCKYAHNFASKEDKKARCWTCGSTKHRQQECPTKSGGRLSLVFIGRQSSSLLMQLKLGIRPSSRHCSLPRFGELFAKSTASAKPMWLRSAQLL